MHTSIMGAISDPTIEHTAVRVPILPASEEIQPGHAAVLGSVAGAQWRGDGFGLRPQVNGKFMLNA